MYVADKASGISEQTIAKFLLNWPKWFADTHYKKWVAGIDTIKELKKVEGDFAKLGFPGCVSWMDAVHFHDSACPAALKTAYTNGKEGEPTNLRRGSGSVVLIVELIGRRHGREDV
jgi:hypothetical protein